MACMSDNLIPLPKRHRTNYSTPEEQIQAMKQEIRDKIKPLRDKLDTLECELLAEVDSLGALQISERVELESKLNTLKKGRTNLENTNKSLVIKSSIDLAIKDLDRKINEVSQELNQFQEINSTWILNYWDDDQYLNANTIDMLCTLSNNIITDSVYKSKSIPKWQIIHGTNPSQLMSPNGFAIQANTNNIFVSDSQGKRIQVFSETGEHILLIEKFTNPLKVFFVNESYIYGFFNSINSSKGILTEIHLSNLKERIIDNYNKNATFKYAHYYSSSSDTNSFIFYSNSQSMIGIISENKPKIEIPNTSAKPWCKSNFDNRDKQILLDNKPIKPVDITVNGDIIYLLVLENDYLVLEFNTDFKLIHSICPSSLLGEPRAICVDKEDNIIIAGHNEDESDTKILILSKDGDIINEIILSCEDCIGIAINSNFNLFVLNNDSNYPLTSI